MVNAQALRDKRFNLWEKAKKFLDEHTDADGKISDEDIVTYERMEKDIIDLGVQIERFEKQASMDAKFNTLHAEYTLISDDYYSQKGDTMHKKVYKYKTTADYDKHFYNAVRGGFRNDSADFLRTDVDSQGGYLVPSELDDAIATKMAAENPMRQICRVIETKTRHEIPILASQPNAQWVAEGAKIDLQSGSFDHVTLGAFKLAAAVKVSNELLADSYYDLQEFFVQEFAKDFAASEEQAFVNGNGTTEPQGFLTALDAATDVAVTTTTAGANLAIDDLVNVVYSLQRAYRSNACWLMHDSALQAVRKIKDNNLQMYWTASTTEGEPPLLLGYPVYSSSFMPQYAAGAPVAAFGDFRAAYVIGDRGQRTFKPLFEVLALNDVSVFLMTERVDGKLVDRNAIKLLQSR